MHIFQPMLKRFLFLTLLTLVIHASEKDSITVHPVYGRTTDSQLVLREYTIHHRQLYLVADPNRLTTQLRTLTADEWTTESPLPLSDTTSPQTRYDRLKQQCFNNRLPLQGAGLFHLAPTCTSIALTVDLCPSHKPLERLPFLLLSEEALATGKAIPVAVAITGAWMKNHTKDLAWLGALQDSSKLAITWINHSNSHPVSRWKNLRQSFLLKPGIRVSAEMVQCEKEMVRRNLTPSLFFRCPGLVSDSTCIKTILNYGLLPLAADGWLAKGERPKPGGILLIHGTGNEPSGVEKFHAMWTFWSHRWTSLAEGF